MKIPPVKQPRLMSRIALRQIEIQYITRVDKQCNTIHAFTITGTPAQKRVDIHN